jgi:hypothetical protein
MTTPSSSPKAMRIASVITAVNVMVASGFSIAGLISPASILPAHYAPTEASIFAMYAAARTILLAVITLGGDFQTFGSGIANPGYSRGCHPGAGLHGGHGAARSRKNLWATGHCRPAILRSRHFKKVRSQMAG